MHAAALRAEIRLPDTHSLKEKRRKMRTVMTQLDRLGVSASEVDYQDTWQRATVGVAAVAPQHGQLEASPWIRNVEPISARTVVEGDRPVTAFAIRALFNRADSAYIRTVPLTQSVR